MTGAGRGAPAPTVYLPEPIAPSGVALLSERCRCAMPWASGGPPIVTAGGADPDDLESAEAIVVRLFRVDEAALERMPRLRAIVKHGVGLDNIDLVAAARRQIPVASTPDASTQAVAEHAIALMLSLCRHLDEGGRAARDNRFHDRSRLQGLELAGQTLGIVGLGRIGRRVARIAGAGFGMSVLAFDPYLPRHGDHWPARLVDSLHVLLDEADIVTLHVPLTRETEGMIGEPALRRLGPGGRLINTARGAVVDEAALVRALAEGWIAGAGLDVFQAEPLAADHPLCRAPNAVLTPHLAGTTAAALDRLSILAARAVLDELSGRRAEHRVDAAVAGALDPT